MQKKPFKIFCLFLSILFIISCSDNEVYDNKVIRLENDYLVFPSEELFHKTINELNNNDNLLSAWESKYAFQSLRSIYNEIMYPLELLSEEAENLTEEELNKEENTRYKELYHNHLKLREKYKNFLIESQDGSLEMDVISDPYSYLVNADGIVKIDGKIYQFKKNTVKIILNGDAAFLSEMKNLNTSADQIYFTKVIRDNVSNWSSGKINTTTTLNCQNEAGKYRVNGQDQVIKWTEPDAAKLQYVINVWSRKKTLGLWLSYNTTMTISGEYKKVYGPSYSEEITVPVSGTSSGSGASYSIIYNFTFPFETYSQDHFEISYSNNTHSTPNVSCQIENWYLIVGG